MKRIVPYEKSFASQKQSIHWSKNNKVEPKDVYKSSHSTYLFDCSDCGHEFEMNLNRMTNNNAWCTICSNRKLCTADCQMCFDKSFASISRAKEWSSENKILPRNVFKSCNKKYIFCCKKCNHSYEQSLNHITNDNAECPYCTNTKLCNNECKFCFDRSFASSPSVKFWSKENKVSPRNIFKSSACKFLFDCKTCGHSSEQSLAHANNKVGCSYCGNFKLCCDESCKFCFDRSFASSTKAKFWSKKNSENPRNVFKSSANTYIFDCGTCKREFEAMLSNITAGKWCSFCKNKTEVKLYDGLLPSYPQLKRRYNVAWCKGERYLPFDFALEDLKIIIELDGIQHFKQVSNWNTPQETQEKDKYKMKCANENGFSVIRLLQEDVCNDSYQWLKELIQTIEKIKNKSPQIVYMCKNTEYDVYTENLDQFFAKIAFT